MSWMAWHDMLCNRVCIVLQEALKVMEFTEEEIRDVFKLLSAVLQMGNIEFMTAGGAQITSKGGRRRNEHKTDPDPDEMCDSHPQYAPLVILGICDSYKK